MWQTHKGGKSEQEDKSRMAVSSGQAAQYCLVSPGTIVNWIAGGMLEAQRTVGGQFRIRVDDLRALMSEHGMRTDQLDGDFGLHPNCWEFWAHHSTEAQSCDRGPTCEDCPVHRSEASKCHEVRPLLPGGTLRAPSCSDCLFFSTVMETKSND
jgi:excisionase family DNA binding protein